LFAGISTFADHLQGRNVVIWSDNTGAEAATKTGATGFVLGACPHM